MDNSPNQSLFFTTCVGFCSVWLEEQKKVIYLAAQFCVNREYWTWEEKQSRIHVYCPLTFQWEKQMGLLFLFPLSRRNNISKSWRLYPHTVSQLECLQQYGMRPATRLLHLFIGFRRQGESFGFAQHRKKKVDHVVCVLPFLYTLKGTGLQFSSGPDFKDAKLLKLEPDLQL